ncbi:MAG: hypothetical protein WBM04_00720 [Candidatus Korobacteraceae bacterium]
MQFKGDGKAEASLLADQSRWQRVVIDSATDGMVEPVSGLNQELLLHLDPQKKAFSMTKPDDLNWIAEFTYEKPQPDVLMLTGEIGGHPVDATLH